MQLRYSSVVPNARSPDFSGSCAVTLQSLDIGGIFTPSNPFSRALRELNAACGGIAVLATLVLFTSCHSRSDSGITYSHETMSRVPWSIRTLKRSKRRGPRLTDRDLQVASRSDFAHGDEQALKLVSVLRAPRRALASPPAEFTHF